MNLDYETISDEMLGKLLREHIKFFNNVNNLFEVCPISACSAFLLKNVECQSIPVTVEGVEYVISITKNN